MVEKSFCVNDLKIRNFFVLFDFFLSVLSVKSLKSFYSHQKRTREQNIFLTVNMNKLSNFSLDHFLSLSANYPKHNEWNSNLKQNKSLVVPTEFSNYGIYFIHFHLGSNGCCSSLGYCELTKSSFYCTRLFYSLFLSVNKTVA